MNVLEVLKDDHATVDRLFANILSTASNDKSQRQKLFESLKTALIAHAHAEEQVFYPPLREKQQSHDIVEEGIEEHHQVEAMLRKMQSIPMDSDDWIDAVQKLKEDVQHHVREEESEIFPKARQLLGDQTLDGMTENLMRVKEQEAKSAH